MLLRERCFLFHQWSSVMILFLNYLVPIESGSVHWNFKCCWVVFFSHVSLMHCYFIWRVASLNKKPLLNTGLSKNLLDKPKGTSGLCRSGARWGGRSSDLGRWVSGPIQTLTAPSSATWPWASHGTQHFLNESFGVVSPHGDLLQCECKLWFCGSVTIVCEF